jgi:hypothetical protein
LTSTGLANPVLERVRVAWGRYRIVWKPAMFLGGVLWDYLTLRIDRTLDHLLLLAYFTGLLCAFAFQMRVERGRWVPEVLVDRAWILDLVSSFFLGALLSALGITVLRATHPGPAALFLGLLAGLAIANEVGVTAFRGIVVRFGMVAFLAFQLTSLVVPVLFGRLVGPGMGILGTMVAVSILLTAIERGPVDEGSGGRNRASRNRRRIRRWMLDRGVPIGASALSVAGLLVLIQLGVVPPLPLVLREAVLARDVKRVGGDEPYAIVEPRRRAAVLQVLLGPPSIDWQPGQTVAVYTAVFAPADIELSLFAVWERWDDETGEWVRTDRIEQSIEGGRTGGWRSWTRKRHMKLGSWRVRVETPEGREVGRIRFEVTEPAVEASGAGD